MLLIQKDMVVSVHYELQVEHDGQMNVADKSQEQPLVYLHGAGMLLPEFEQNLLGKSVGNAVNFVINAENGYGVFDEKNIANVPLDSFKDEQGNIDTNVIKVGNVLPMMDNHGNQFQGIVCEVNDDIVIMDFNHPLAGKDLHFAVTVVDVRAATEEELAHGHVHGAGGVQH
jgi:FKBP-type peptidyl-prolyl cis-trans isomerase SlyD